jgi:hypothetical protein
VNKVTVTLILSPLSGILARRGTPQENAPHPASQEHLHGIFVELGGSDKKTALDANVKEAHYQYALPPLSVHSLPENGIKGIRQEAAGAQHLIQATEKRSRGTRGPYGKRRAIAKLCRSASLRMLHKACVRSNRQR